MEDGIQIPSVLDVLKQESFCLVENALIVYQIVILARTIQHAWLALLDMEYSTRSVSNVLKKACICQVEIVSV